ncbi:hypothetical protein [Salidesulfovibrio brasiliensis]|uniref:hypothetical protein n=1 Tax=Salidesulfovibrio brasiliensis TaxID=221711 RepID=UPI0006CF2474|nr:hypothetical protein [Salidesulfovibrio brasiliensis]
MLITNKRAFSIGAVLTAVFMAVLWYMFTDNFGGTNAFHASDALFNSISKGSTYYIPDVKAGALKFSGDDYTVTVLDKQPDLVNETRDLLVANGIAAQSGDKGLMVSGKLGVLLDAVIRDADRMFHNEGDELKSRYGMEPRKAMYLWWAMLTSLKKELDLQKQFAAASYVDKMVIKRAVEVAYNYYGIEARDVSEEAGIITFALIFYVVYTMWWGYSIFFLFEGFGLEMKAGKKKEV